MSKKSLVDWLNLSANLYLISKDDDVRKIMSKFSSFIIEKIEKEGDDKNKNDDVAFSARLKERIKEAEEEFLKQIQFLLPIVYDKIHLVHNERFKRTEDELNNLKREVALIEAKFVAMQRNGKIH